MFDKLRRRLLPASMLGEGELDVALAEAKVSVLTARDPTQRHFSTDRLLNLWPRLRDRYPFLLQGVEISHEQDLHDARYFLGTGDLRAGPSVRNVTKEALVYAVFFAWMGGYSRFLGDVCPYQQGFVVDAANDLIEDNHEAGFFLKGLVLKYGITPSAVPNIPEARDALERAVAAGADYAGTELYKFKDYEFVLGSVTGREPFRWPSSEA